MNVRIRKKFRKENSACSPTLPRIPYLLIICCKTVTVAVQRKVCRVFSISCGDMAAVNIRCGERPSTRVQAYDRRRRGLENQICHAGLAHVRSGSAAEAEKTSPSAPTSVLYVTHAWLAQLSISSRERERCDGGACWGDASLCKVALRKFVTAGVRSCRLPVRAPTLARSGSSTRPKS